MCDILICVLKASSKHSGDIFLSVVSCDSHMPPAQKYTCYFWTGYLSPSRCAVCLNDRIFKPRTGVQQLDDQRLPPLASRSRMKQSAVDAMRTSTEDTTSPVPDGKTGVTAELGKRGESKVNLPWTACSVPGKRGHPREGLGFNHFRRHFPPGGFLVFPSLGFHCWYICCVFEGM